MLLFSLGTNSRLLGPFLTVIVNFGESDEGPLASLLSARVKRDDGRFDVKKSAIQLGRHMRLALVMGRSLIIQMTSRGCTQGTQ